MPEGDTIHKIAAAMRARLTGATIRRVRLRHQEAGSLVNRRIEDVYAHGKHLFIELQGGLLLRSHLGMYGSWHRYRPDGAWRKPKRQAALVLWTDRDVFVCFNALEVECLRATGIRSHNLSHRLGPDLLAPNIELEKIPQRAREFLDPETPLVDVLLDQRVACGIGNVYKSEVLFIEKQNPFTPLEEIPKAKLKRLYSTARSLLRRNLGGGPRITRFSNDGAGRLWVYGRHGKPCLCCGDSIGYERSGTDMRSTYWCPTCQSTTQDSPMQKPAVT